MGQAQQKNNGTANTSVWEKAVPLALALMPDNSICPYVSLVPLELLSLHWSSEPVISSVSPCTGPFRVMPVSPATLHHTHACWFSQAEVMVSSLPSTGNLGWGAWCRAGIPCSLGEEFHS